MDPIVTNKEKGTKIQNQDNQKILKIRLKRIILNNKEKVKVIDEYIKKMTNIDE